MLRDSESIQYTPAEHAMELFPSIGISQMLEQLDLSQKIVSPAVLSAQINTQRIQASVSATLERKRLHDTAECNRKVAVEGILKIG